MGNKSDGETSRLELKRDNEDERMVWLLGEIERLSKKLDDSFIEIEDLKRKVSELEKKNREQY